MAAKDGAKTKGQQLLHLVFGGELTTLDKIEFSDLKRLDIPITRKPMMPGRTPPTAPSTTRICATSSYICTACSTRARALAARRHSGFFALEASSPAC